MDGYSGVPGVSVPREIQKLPSDTIIGGVSVLAEFFFLVTSMGSQLPLPCYFLQRPLPWSAERWPSA